MGKEQKQVIRVQHTLLQFCLRASISIGATTLQKENWNQRALSNTVKLTAVRHNYTGKAHETSNQIFNIYHLLLKEIFDNFQ